MLSDLDGPPVVVHDLGPGAVPPVGPPASAPCVVVGRAPRHALPDRLPACDVYVTDGAGPPHPWVGGGDETLTDLLAAIGHSPLASVVLVQLLRMGLSLDPVQALVAESLAYATLQAGPEHAAWLAARPARAADGAAGTHRGGAGADPLRRVAFGRHGDRLDITLDRPAKRNAVDALLRDQLIEALTPANLDGGIVRVELRGNGPSFCAGGDLAEFGTVADPAVGHLIRTARSLPLAVLGCAPRLTTHVHGHTVGAGVELAAFGARVVATPTTVFTLPEVAMGLIPGAGGTVSLPRRIGRARATAFALTGRPLDAVTAQRWGLVDEFTALEPADGEGVG